MNVRAFNPATPSSSAVRPGAAAAPPSQAAPADQALLSLYSCRTVRRLELAACGAGLALTSGGMAAAVAVGGAGGLALAAGGLLSGLAAFLGGTSYLETHASPQCYTRDSVGDYG